MNELLGMNGPAMQSADQNLQPSLAAGADVLDVSLQNFRAEVIDESTRRLVLVDFWAPWCGPCRQLTPVIEKVVAARRGEVRLAKMNIDVNPEIAQQLGIQSIPAVVAFHQGKMVDAFMGALPEREVKAFVDRCIGPAAEDPEALFVEAQALLDAGDVDSAEAVFGRSSNRRPSTPARSPASRGWRSSAARSTRPRLCSTPFRPNRPMRRRWRRRAPLWR